MSDARPIGVVDSGLGGLTVVKELLRAMPNESVIYFGDTAHFPYGCRSEEAIRRNGMQSARFVLGHDVKMLVVACSTMSSVLLDDISKEMFDVPLIGAIVPVVKAAAKRTMNKKIGVLGTAATVNSRAYEKIIRDIDPECKPYQKACPLFVPIVEEGLYDSEIARLVAQKYCAGLVEQGTDIVILACTHYPLLMETIQETVGANITVLDSALWIAREAREILHAIGGFCPQSMDNERQSWFYVSDVAPTMIQCASAFFGSPMLDLMKVELSEVEKSI